MGSLNSKQRQRKKRRKRKADAKRRSNEPKRRLKLVTKEILTPVANDVLIEIRSDVMRMILIGTNEAAMATTERDDGESPIVGATKTKGGEMMVERRTGDDTTMTEKVRDEAPANEDDPKAGGMRSA